ncbi:MAG: ABC transporter permease subunit [Eubacterium sp.]
MPNIFVPQMGGFPTIILWALVAIAIVWFIWNKTTFGKNLFAVGLEILKQQQYPGISVFKVTMGEHSFLQVFFMDLVHGLNVTE